MKFKRIAFLFILIILLGVVPFIFFDFGRVEAPTENGKIEIIQKEHDAIQEENREEKNQEFREMETKESGTEKKELALPEKISLKVPFTSQAPFAKWDAVHEETCEEASLVMVKYYLEGKRLTPEIAERELQALVEFQNKKRGDYKDTNAQETADLGRDFYGIKNFKVVYDFSQEDLRKQLALGKPIIVPAAGRELKNPNFTSPGPLYHMLVLTRYDGNTIITNDSGTRKGEGYEYDADVLYSAIHDFPGKLEDIKTGRGRKAMIVLE